MDLREKTIELIQKEGQFDMTTFTPRYSTCGTACCIAGNICRALGLDVATISYNKVPSVARLAWAKAYGEEEANRLQFTEDGWGINLHEVTTAEAVAHLNGAPPVIHGACYESL